MLVQTHQIILYRIYFLLQLAVPFDEFLVFFNLGLVEDNLLFKLVDSIAECLYLLFFFECIEFKLLKFQIIFIVKS